MAKTCKFIQILFVFTPLKASFHDNEVEVMHTRLNSEIRFPMHCTFIGLVHRRFNFFFPFRVRTNCDNGTAWFNLIRWKVNSTSRVERETFFHQLFDEGKFDCGKLKLWQASSFENYLWGFEWNSSVSISTMRIVRVFQRI